MRISYQHVNPSAGNETFLLRFEDDSFEGTPCLLVDAGQDARVDDDLSGDDYLAAICLTHAHLDHYENLPRCHRDDVPIFTSPATAAVLPDVFDVAARDYDVRQDGRVADCVRGVDDWTTVVPGVDVRPIPAGHTPGAVGFVVRVRDGDETLRLLATGDFTARAAAAFPGFDPEQFLDVDVLFLTVASDDAFSERITDALGEVLERARAGGPVLVTTSGLNGVHVATLLARAVERFDLSIPVRVVGQVAKHYANLGYDDRVETVPVFEDPQQCLASGVVTIAGPEIPRERSSGRLFDAIRDDPAATVVQLTSGGYAPVESEPCTVSRYTLVNHPTADALADVVPALEPVHTVLVHTQDVDATQFRDRWQSYVWATGDDRPQVLYADGDWEPPDWVGDRAAHYVRSQGAQTLGSVSQLGGDLPLPSIDRRPDVELAAEGVDVGRLRKRLHVRPESPELSPTTGDESATESATDPERDAPRTNDPETDATAAQTNDPETDATPPTPNTMTDEETSPTDRPDATLYRTVGAELDDSTVDVGELVETDDPDNLVDVRARQQLAEVADAAADGATADADAAAEPSVDDEAGSDVEAGDAEDSADTDDAPAESDDVGADGEASANAELDDAELDDDGAGGDAESSANDGSDTSDPGASDGLATFDGEAWTLDLDPVVVALAALTADRDGAVDSVEELAVTAVDTYLTSLLRGDATHTDTTVDRTRRATLDADPALARLVERAVDVDSNHDALADLLLEAVSGTVPVDSSDGTLTVSGLAPFGSFVEGVVENDEYALDSVDAVVQTAVEAYVGVGEADDS